VLACAHLMLERIGARPGVLDRARSRIASAWFLSASCRLDRAGVVVKGSGEADRPAATQRKRSGMDNPGGERTKNSWCSRVRAGWWREWVELVASRKDGAHLKAWLCSCSCAIWSLTSMA